MGGDNQLFNALNDEKMKSPNIHEKEDEYTSKIVQPILTLKFILLLFSIASLSIFWLLELHGFGNWHLPFPAYFAIPFLFALSLIFLHPVKIDTFVPHLASVRIGSVYCSCGLKKITMDYDLANSKKDINKFIEEITEKSEEYNYFMDKLNPTTMKLTLKVRPKVKIPERADFSAEFEENEQWNYVPLGLCLTDKSVVGTVNWMLNDNNDVKGEHKETIPSTSFLVAGGTGSGKSVLENNIIRHVNKFNDNFQSMLVDVKRVEFGGLSNLQGIKAVALDIEEAKGCLVASQAIMMSRFQFMEKAGVNNVYKLKDYKCSYFLIQNHDGHKKKLYQFDEIFYCHENGEILITTIDDIYKRLKNGSKIEIFFSGQKEKSIEVVAEKDKINEDTLFIREIFASENFFINKDIKFKDDVIKTKEGDKKAEDIYDEVYDRNEELHLLNGTTLNKENVKIIECIFKPKAILTVVDEMSEVMATNNYKAQSAISDAISSIARLGRAAGCHLCLAPLPEDLELTVIQDRKRSYDIVNEYVHNLKNKLEGKEYNLPNYFENFSDEEIKEHIIYSSQILSIIENVLILNETDKVSLNIKWKDLKLGDIIDDSVVIYIGDWTEEQCYKIIAEDGSSIEASSTHLFKANIYKDSEIINDDLELSKNIRSNLKEDDSCWVCVEDIISSIDNNLKVYLDCGSEIISYKKTDIKNVRCIQTTKGEYAIEGK